MPFNDYLVSQIKEIKDFLSLKENRDKDLIKLQSNMYKKNALFSAVFRKNSEYNIFIDKINDISESYNIRFDIVISEIKGDVRLVVNLKDFVSEDLYASIKNKVYECYKRFLIEFG
nr:hypothetical protein [Halomonas sp.]